MLTHPHTRRTSCRARPEAAKRRQACYKRPCMGCVSQMSDFRGCRLTPFLGVNRVNRPPFLGVKFVKLRPAFA
jgi:hypothetical protein